MSDLRVQMVGDAAPRWAAATKHLYRYQTLTLARSEVHHEPFPPDSEPEFASQEEPDSRFTEWSAWRYADFTGSEERRDGP